MTSRHASGTRNGNPARIPSSRKRVSIDRPDTMGGAVPRKAYDIVERSASDELDDAGLLLRGYTTINEKERRDSTQSGEGESEPLTQRTCPALLLLMRIIRQSRGPL